MWEKVRERRSLLFGAVVYNGVSYPGAGGSAVRFRIEHCDGIAMEFVVRYSQARPGVFAYQPSGDIWPAEPVVWGPAAISCEERVQAVYEEALAHSGAAPGRENPEGLSLANNRAIDLAGWGDNAGALALHERVLGARRRILGDVHPNTLTSKNNIASILLRQGDVAGARALNEEVLAARRLVLGDDHPDTLTSINNLANALWAAGDAAGARALLEPAVATMRRLLGDSHPNTVTSMESLATARRAQGNEAGARVLDRLVRAASPPVTSR